MNLTAALLHARRKVEAATTYVDQANVLLRMISALYDIETRAKTMNWKERGGRRERESTVVLAGSRDVAVLVISRPYLNHMIGDLSYSTNKRTKGRTQRELFDLCDRLESIERYGEGELDYWD